MMRCKDDIYKSFYQGRTDIMQLDCQRKVIVGARHVAAFCLSDVVADFEVDTVTGAKLANDIKAAMAKIDRAQNELQHALSYKDRVRRNVRAGISEHAKIIEAEGGVMCAAAGVEKARARLNRIWRRICES